MYKRSLTYSDSFNLIHKFDDFVTRNIDFGSCKGSEENSKRFYEDRRRFNSIRNPHFWLAREEILGKIFD